MVLRFDLIDAFPASIWTFSSLLFGYSEKTFQFNFYCALVWLLGNVCRVLDILDQAIKFTSPFLIGWMLDVFSSVGTNLRIFSASVFFPSCIPILPRNFASFLLTSRQLLPDGKNRLLLKFFFWWRWCNRSSSVHNIFSFISASCEIYSFVC